MLFAAALRRRTPPALLLLPLLLLPLAPSASAQEAVPVAVASAEMRTVEEHVTLNGTVTSPRFASLSPSVGGLVQEIHKTLGDRVEKGEVLVSLDSGVEQLNLESARAGLREAEALLADSRRRLAEAERLASEGILPQSDERSLVSEVSADQAAVDRLRAEERRSAELLSRHRLRAPFSGVVSGKLTEVGEWIAPGDGALQLVATEGLWLDFQVSQEYYPRLGPETTLDVSFPAIPDRTFAGHVEAAVPVSDRDARTFLLRVGLDEKAKITPGMSARAALRLDSKRQGVVIPRDALLRYPDGRVTVWVVEESAGRATVAERMVQPGVAFADQVEIRQGVEAGEKVVTHGNESLQDGQAVRSRTP